MQYQSGIICISVSCSQDFFNYCFIYLLLLMYMLCTNLSKCIWLITMYINLYNQFPLITNKIICQLLIFFNKSIGGLFIISKVCFIFLSHYIKNNYHQNRDLRSPMAPLIIIRKFKLISIQSRHCNCYYGNAPKIRWQNVRIPAFLQQHLLSKILVCEATSKMPYHFWQRRIVLCLTKPSLPGVMAVIQEQQTYILKSSLAI